MLWTWLYIPYLNWQFWFFGPSLPKEGISGRKQKNLKLPWNSTIVWTILYNKFQLKLAILIFWTKFGTLEYFQSRTERFGLFGPNLPKRLLLIQNRKSQCEHWILHSRISLKGRFRFFDQIYPKRLFRV